MFLKQTSSLPAGCISDLTLDAWRSGELSTTRNRELSEHVARCEYCAARQRVLSGHAQEFLARSDQPLQLARLRTKLQRKRSSLLPAGLGAAIMFASLLVWAAPHAASPAIRSKGPSSIGFYVRRGEQVFRGHEGARLRPGDQLRFTWRSDRPAYLAILSRDAAQVVSTYYPPANVQPLLTPTGAEVELASAVELDDTLGTEQLFVISCVAPPSVAQLRKQLEQRGTLEAPAGCELDRLRLEKEARP
jgi:hypothetical protein